MRGSSMATSGGLVGEEEDLVGEGMGLLVNTGSGTKAVGGGGEEEGGGVGCEAGAGGGEEAAGGRGEEGLPEVAAANCKLCSCCS